METNTQISYSNTLTQAGLALDQATIYELLIQNGAMPAGKISQKTPLKRGLVYKVLDELIAMGLVLKKEVPGKVALFEPAHPLKLKELAEKKEEQAKNAQNVLNGVLGALTSSYNLVSGKPGVLFYEGLDGVSKVLDDSLESKTEILSYVDIEAIVKNIDSINKAYATKRERLQIKKRGIILDSPFAREYLSNYYTAVTDSKLITYDAPPFQSVMQIYDNKISYITLVPGKMMGVIIEDMFIYNMHKYLFEFLWSVAPSNDVLTKKPTASKN
jgi:sugar-specific transcriptional regulator TrmB